MDINYPAIQFNKVFDTGNELRYMREAMESGRTCGNGPFTKICNQLIENIIGTPKSILTTSCTHALETAALLLDIKPGDEVIAPAFTFVSTVNAFVLRGARPVFCDIRPDTLNLDEAKLTSLITSRTKAIVPVHYAGVGCEMDAIMATANQNSVPVIEDNAHGLFSKYKEKYLGTFGCMATQSFHETKNFSCGEGGALLINDQRYIERAEVIVEKGTNRSRFFRGQVDKYSWIDIGSSYILSDMLAAYLLSQLESREHIQNIRRRIWSHYKESLSAWATKNGVILPTVPEHCEQAYHMFYLLMPSLRSRQLLIAHLRSMNISSAFHYVPLHLSAMGQKFGGKIGDCPVTEDLSDRLVRLPFHSNLTGDELDIVSSAICAFS